MIPLNVHKITGRILVVDDEVASVRQLERTLAFAGCSDHPSTTDPHRALDLCVATCPDAVLLDLNMPDVDGIALLENLAARFPSRALMPILVLTPDSSSETKYRALQAGASDLLIKPLDPLELVMRLGNHLEIRRMHVESREREARLEQRVRERTAALEEAQAEIVERLAVATEMRDGHTHDHVERVSELTGGIATEMSVSPEESDILRRAVRLHDVGKIAVPESILLKDGPLTDEEQAAMREHAAAGGRLLQGSRFPVMVRAAEIARSHHERWDGTGYPDGLRGDSIPLGARIAAVADAYDALTRDRPHRQAWLPEAALAEIMRRSGSHFDPMVVRAFRAVLERETDVPSERRVA